MRSEEQKKVGNGLTSVNQLLLVFLLAVSWLIPDGAVIAETMYKYRGENGEWIYSDRAPPENTSVEIRQLPKGEVAAGVSVSHRISNGRFRFIAKNDYYAPVEIVLALKSMDNLALPPPELDLRWVVPARSRSVLLELALLDPDAPANANYSNQWLPGDPNSEHAPTGPYRAPFAIASDYRITQAFPLGTTHRTPDSYYAVDFSMPIGTDIYAARAGTVFEVASTNFSGGVNPERYLNAANVIRIVHDDGTYAVYAHLNWNTIRVRPGDKVARGQYIADSGNTGFSSGPHLHFAVIRNKGLRLVSVPVVFEGPNDSEVAPATGNDLVAY